MNTTVSEQSCAICARTDAARYAPGPRVAICVDCANLQPTDLGFDAKRCAFCCRRAEAGLEQGDRVICASASKESSVGTQAHAGNFRLVPAKRILEFTCHVVPKPDRLARTDSRYEPAVRAQRHARRAQKVVVCSRQTPTSYNLLQIVRIGLGNKTAIRPNNSFPTGTKAQSHRLFGVVLMQ